MPEIIINFKTKRIMQYETNCSQVTQDESYSLMRGARKCSYRLLVKRIKEELPMLYNSLSLNLYNPWCEDCKQTKTHYILVHSAIEYFIRK